MKSKETIVMRPISKEVQRDFLADFRELVSVIVRSPPSAASCKNSPGKKTKQNTDVLQDYSLRSICKTIVSVKSSIKKNFHSI